MQYMCNPVNCNYHYQFHRNDESGEALQINREAADPSMIVFQGKYYIFVSMNLSVWVSEDLVHWDSYPLPENLPLYDYAPDVRVMGDYVYFSASKRGEICNFYRTKDILNGPYEEIAGTFDFWDPNLFLDDDGRVYFYWGCSSVTPVWGVELDPKTMRPKTERIVLIQGDPAVKGYERTGDDHCRSPQSGARPYIEGAWMDKHNGRYYLQYACPGTEFNIYADGVYVSENPLGPFTLASNNPFSYKPGGFLPGAGHGSTMEDLQGNLWHTSTMQISMNHMFERRVGIWPAGYDSEGELFCNQRYGDWPMAVTGGRQDPWREPEWFLMSYGKRLTASSSVKGKGPELAADENARTWWQAASAEDQWLLMDLGKLSDVRAVQINFADDHPDVPCPQELNTGSQTLYIEERPVRTRWILEGSKDGERYEVIADRSASETDLSHDFVVYEEGLRLRYLRLRILEVPYGQCPCVSGLRVFGIGDGEKPEAPEYFAERTGDLDMRVRIVDTGAVGYNILWGHAPEKLYHSYMIFGSEQRIGALVQGQEYYVRVDAFNENGITEGVVKKL